MKNKSANDLVNHPVISDFLSQLLGEMKNGVIKPLTNEEPKVLQNITNQIFGKLGSDSIEASVLKELSKEIFFQWRGNTEIGVSIMCEFPRIKTSGSLGVTGKTSVDYGFSCTKYSDFEKKLNMAKQQKEAQLV